MNNILKLTGLINWGWLWALSPLWISCAIVLICLVGFLILRLFSNKQARPKKKEAKKKAKRK